MVYPPETVPLITAVALQFKSTKVVAKVNCGLIITAGKFTKQPKVSVTFML